MKRAINCRSVTHAFKEWAAVCAALAAGRQILILRKGGIHEPGRAFRPEHDEFALFPTAFHQSADQIRPDDHAFWRAAQQHQPSDGTITISHVASIAERTEIRSLDVLLRLCDEHIFSDTVIQERFSRWQNAGLHAMIVRVSKLTHPVTIPLRDEYGGCKSWVELAEPIATAGAVPVLSEQEFERRHAAVNAKIKGG